MADMQGLVGRKSDATQKPTVVGIGPDALPDPDPRVAGGFGQPPVRDEPTPAQDRHPAGVPEGGRFR